MTFYERVTKSYLFLTVSSYKNILIVYRPFIRYTKQRYQWLVVPRTLQCPHKSNILPNLGWTQALAHIISGVGQESSLSRRLMKSLLRDIRSPSLQPTETLRERKKIQQLPRLFFVTGHYWNTECNRKKKVSCEICKARKKNAFVSCIQ